MQPHGDGLGEIRLVDDDGGRFTADDSAEHHETGIDVAMQRHQRLARNLERLDGEIAEFRDRIRRNGDDRQIEKGQSGIVDFDREQGGKPERQFGKRKRGGRRCIGRSEVQQLAGRKPAGRDRINRLGVDGGRQRQSHRPGGLDADRMRAARGENEAWGWPVRKAAKTTTAACR